MKPAVLAACLLLLPSPSATASVLDCGLPPDSEPCPIWTARHDGSTEAGGTASDIAVAPDGSSVFVSGGGATVVSYDVATGAERWVVNYGQGVDHIPEAMVVSRDGASLFVTGPSPGAGNDYLTVALDADTGKTVWTVRLDGAGLDDYPWDIAPSADDTRIYVTGYLDEGPAKGARNFTTVAYDAATGEQIWIAKYDGPAHSGEVARAIDVGTFTDEQGRVRERVFITGRSNGANPSDAKNDYATVAYDGETGAHLWEARYDGPTGGRDYPIALAVSPDQNTVYLTGESTAPDGGFDYAVVAYDASTGAERWVSRLDRADDPDVPQISSTTDILGDIEASPTGNGVYVTGYGAGREQPFDRTALTFGLDPESGTTIWSATRTGPLGEAGHELMVSPDGQTTYVTGQAAIAGGGIVTTGSAVTSSVAGYLTVAYDASGTEKWVAHYGMVGSDATFSGAAASPDGSHLFLTGTEFQSFQTVAYRT